jgi:hypothetical protein
VLVIYVPFLQTAFHTAPLSMLDWLVATAVASTLLILMEVAKFVWRGQRQHTISEQLAPEGPHHRA